MKKFEDVRERVFQFVLRIMKLCGSLSKTEANKIITSQILRSSTSIGANLEEAVGAHTRSDFIYTMNIAKKEIRETNYWLKLIHASNNIAIRNRMTSLLQEGEELAKILTVSVKNASKRQLVINS